MPFFSIIEKASVARVTFSVSKMVLAWDNLDFMAIKSSIFLFLKCVISSRLFSLSTNRPVSRISREMSQDLSSSVFSIVKSMSNLVNVSSSPACAMMASTASTKRFSVSSVTSKVIGKPRSWAKARITLCVNLSIVEMSKAA